MKLTTPTKKGTHEESAYSTYSQETIFQLSQYLKRTQKGSGKEQRITVPTDAENFSKKNIDLNFKMLKPRDTNKFSTKIFKRLGCSQSETHFNENTLAKLEYLLNQITPGIKIIDSRFDASKLTHLLLSRVETDPLKNEKCSKLGLNNFLLARFT